MELFGEARVRKAGGEIALSPQQLALVSLVYGHGPEGVSRLLAARLLWNDDAPGKSRQRIRQLLLDIRTRVGSPIIDTPADMLRPSPHVSCDLPVFQDALKRGPLEQAAVLVGRGFISTGFPTPEPFDDWRAGRATRLLREVRVRSFARWSQAFEQADWKAALDAAEALYTLDPEDPVAVERVIEARARVGKLPSAEAVFARYVAALAPGEEPTVEIRQTMERVRALAQLDRGEKGRAEPRVPLVGRQATLLSARKALEVVSAGDFKLVLLSGESGIGKSRVLDEIHREALLHDFRCLRAQSVELERSIPLNPILDALDGLDIEPHLEAVGPPWSSVIASLLPPGTLARPREEPPPIQASSLSRRLLDSFALLFEQLAREQPTLLFLDDLQWADATTVAALQFLQRRWAGGPFGVFAAIRPELVRPADPVRKYLAASGELAVQVIELRALESAEALELIDAISEGRVVGERARRLCEIAGRHPLYLTELTRDLMAGTLTLPGSPGEQVAIPSSLGAMLDARLESMDDAAMRVAGVLAVAAKPLRVTAIAELTRLGPEDAASAIDVLGRARFVEVEHRRARIAHELFRSAIYRHLSEPRRAVHHRAIAERLLRESPEESGGELAVHLYRAGEHELAAKHGWLAATRAIEAGAIAEAIQLFEVVAESESDPVRRADATAALAKALCLSRDISKANPKLRLAATQLRATGRAALARHLEIRRVEGMADVAASPVSELLEALALVKQEAREFHDWESVALALDVELHLLHRQGDVPGIRLVLQEMREVAGKGSVEARLLSRAGLALGVFFDDPDEALAAAREAVELASEGSAYRLRALVRLMVVLQALGQLTQPEAAPVVEEARNLAKRSGDVLAQFSIESNFAVALLDTGDLDAAEALMQGANEMAKAGEMDINRFIQANNHGEMALALEDYETAADAFRRAASFLSLTTPTYMQDLVNAGLGFCALETGDLTEARRRADRLHDPPERWYFDPTTILTFRSRMLARQGRYAEADDLLAASCNDLQGRLVLAWLKAMLLRVRILAKWDPGCARELAEDAQQAAKRLQLTFRARECRRLAERLSIPPSDSGSLPFRQV